MGHDKMLSSGPNGHHPSILLESALLMNKFVLGAINEKEFKYILY